MVTGRHRPGRREMPSGPEAGQATRMLLYVPVVHTQADLGALGAAAARATLARAGRQGLAQKGRAIERLWDEIHRVLDGLKLPFPKVRLYQDGLPVCGREAEIVVALARNGSRNHQLLLALIARGARLMGTEAPDLLAEEYELANQTLKSPPIMKEAAQKAQRSDSLLDRRDRFIARRINETLEPGETGLLFIGLLHCVASHLDRDIRVSYPVPGRR